MTVSDELVEMAADRLLAADVLRAPVAATETFMRHRARCTARVMIEAILPAIQAETVERCAKAADVLLENAQRVEREVLALEGSAGQLFEAKCRVKAATECAAAIRAMGEKP